MDLPLRAPISISSELALDSIGLDMADVKVKIFKFTISLLGITIQDGGMRERGLSFILVTIDPLSFLILKLCSDTSLSNLLFFDSILQ